MIRVSRRWPKLYINAVLPKCEDWPHNHAEDAIVLAMSISGSITCCAVRSANVKHGLGQLSQ